ncbi:hypothetical protein ACROYT_G000618 [Oculina patagonica]
MTASIFPTPSTDVRSSTVSPTTPPEKYNYTTFQVIIEFVDFSWKMEFLNKSSPEYMALRFNITEAVEMVLDAKNLSSNVQVMEFKPGSVLAFLNISTDKPMSVVKQTLQNQMLNGTIGAFNVSKTLFSGSLFDVVLKIKAECNESLEHKDFNQSVRESLTRAVNKALPGNEKATVQKVKCPDPGNVTIVTVRLQDDNSSTENPNKELESLQDEVKKGRLGNFTVIPEWEAYIPGEKLFSVSFSLSNPSQDNSKTIQDLEQAIKNIFENDTDYKYVTVELLEDNKTAVVKVGMKTGAADQPNEALKPLKDSVNQGKVGQIPLVKNSFKAYVNPNTLTKKEFKIRFRLNMTDCDAKKEEATDLVEDYINRLNNYQYFIKAMIQTLDCVNGNVYKQQRMAQAWFLVYVSPAAPDSREQFMRYLLKCGTEGDRGPTYDGGVRVVTLTPTSPEMLVGADYTHPVCIKPKTPKSTYTTPTTPLSTIPTKGPASSSTPPIEQKPSLYVKVKLGITWGEFCSKLEHSLKQKIAWNLYDKNGTRVSPDRIIYINVEKNCADPSKKDEHAEVWFYVSQSGSKKLHKCLTLKAYKLLKMFLENGNTKLLGPEFEGKVIHVDLAGEDSTKHKTGYDNGDLSTLAIILIAIAGAVGLLLLTLACCCLFCCGGKHRKRQKDEDSQRLQVVHVYENCTDTSGKKGKKGNDGDKKKKEKDKNKKQKRKGDADGSDEEGKRKDANSDEHGEGNVVSYDNKAYGHGKDDGNLNDRNANKPVALAPVIVTSPAPEADKAGDDSNKNKGGQASETASSGSGGSRRGSASIGGEGQGSGAKQSSPVALRQIDANLIDRGRRRSSAHSIIDDEDIPLTHKTGTVGIVALALRNRNEKKKEAEFKNLNKDVPEEEVSYPANTHSKNRSPDVLPAPKTRVKLSSNPDYINANWIRDHKGQVRYIATQHPLHETADDFWQMVWDQKSHLVVMVNEEEKEKPTEFMDYLPRGEGNTKSFGGIEVTIKQIVKKADYTLTTLNIADNKKSSSSREVSHMRFTSWKERAMPNVALFVGFVTATREARKKYGDSKAPTIVHCSDGLGFSGVYIAVDIGIKSHEESKTSVVDVFELSKKLRRDRHGIVCTLEHYNFIYQALYEYTVNYDESAETQKL